MPTPESLIGRFKVPTHVTERANAASHSNPLFTFSEALPGMRNSNNATQTSNTTMLLLALEKEYFQIAYASARELWDLRATHPISDASQQAPLNSRPRSRARRSALTRMPSTLSRKHISSARNSQSNNHPPDISRIKPLPSQKDPDQKRNFDEIELVRPQIQIRRPRTLKTSKNIREKARNIIGSYTEEHLEVCFLNNLSKDPREQTGIRALDCRKLWVLGMKSGLRRIPQTFSANVLALRIRSYPPSAFNNLISSKHHNISVYSHVVLPPGSNILSLKETLPDFSNTLLFFLFININSVRIISMAWRNYRVMVGLMLLR